MTFATVPPPTARPPAMSAISGSFALMPPLGGASSAAASFRCGSSLPWAVAAFSKRGLRVHVQGLQRPCRSRDRAIRAGPSDSDDDPSTVCTQQLEKRARLVGITRPRSAGMGVGRTLPGGKFCRRRGRNGSRAAGADGTATERCSFAALRFPQGVGPVHLDQGIGERCQCCSTRRSGSRHHLTMRREQSPCAVRTSEAVSFPTDRAQRDVRVADSVGAREATLHASMRAGGYRFERCRSSSKRCPMRSIDSASSEGPHGRCPLRTKAGRDSADAHRGGSAGSRRARDVLEQACGGGRKAFDVALVLDASAVPASSFRGPRGKRHGADCVSARK